jgi:hypothetical protein
MIDDASISSRNACALSVQVNKMLMLASRRIGVRLARIKARPREYVTLIQNFSWLIAAQKTLIVFAP